MPHEFRQETQHPWPDSSVSGGFFLVATNAVLAIIITDLAYKWRWDLAAVLFITMIASILYHGCRAGFLCEERFRNHQVIDHIFVYFSLLYIAAQLGVRSKFFPRHMLLEFPHLLPSARIALFFLMILPATMLNIWNPESKITVLISFGIPAVIVVAGALIVKEPIFYNIKNGIIGTVIFAISLIFFVAPHSWYDWAHSLWHVLAYIAVYFIVFAIEPPLRLEPGSAVSVDWRTGRIKI